MVNSCAVCGDELGPQQNTYCSRECMSEGYTKEKVEKECPNCGDTFEMYPSDDERGRRYCSYDCSMEHYEYDSGEDHHLYNRNTSECDYCGSKFEHKPSKDRRFCSHSCSASYYHETTDTSGPNNPRWKGGVARVTQSQKWREVREKALERDKKRCCECGGDTNLEVHHITPLEEGGRPYDLKNLKTLCRTCHRAKHFG
jgi:hypothetical protein